MAKGISIPVASDTREFSQGINRGVIQPLEDAGTALDDVQRAGDKAGDSLERGFEQARDSVSDFKKAQDRTWEELSSGVKDADRTVDRLDSTFEDLARTAKKAGSDAGKGIRDVDDGAKKAGAGVEELGDEVKQEAREMGASFGDVEDAVDSVQSIISNALGGFGPLGLAAGVAIAVGIGVFTTEAAKAAEKMTELKTKTGELALELYDVEGDISRIDLGAKMREWGNEIQDNKEWWEFWQEGVVDNLDYAEDRAKRFGLSSRDMFRGLSGSDSEAALRSIQGVRDALSESADGVEDARQKYGRYSVAASDAAEADINFQNSGKQLIEQLQKAGQISDETAEKYAKYKEFTDENTAATEAATAAEELRAGALGTLVGNIDDAVGAYEDYTNAETGASDPSAYIEGIRKRREANDAFVSNIGLIAKEFGLSSDESQAILDQGLEFAPMLQSIIDAGMGDEFIAEWRAGVGGAEKIVAGGKYDATGNVVMGVDLGPALTAISTFANQKRYVDFKPRIAGVNSRGGLTI